MMNGFGGMWFGWIFWIAIIVLIIWLIVNQSKKQSTHNGLQPTETALDILKKRFAKGEISKEEFEERKKTLES